MRDSWRPRLEAAGLWNVVSEEERREVAESKRIAVFGIRKERLFDEKPVYKRAFEREKVGTLQDCRECMD
jgi:hypothetical protein